MHVFDEHHALRFQRLFQFWVFGERDLQIPKHWIFRRGHYQTSIGPRLRRHHGAFRQPQRPCNTTRQDVIDLIGF